MSASIEINFSPGDSIEDAAKEALVLANKLGIMVTFKFNDVTCGIRPNGNAERLANLYFEVGRKDTKYKFAFV